MPFTQLHRSDHDRVVAGVCAGIAETIDVDPTVVRLVFTLLALAGGAGIVLYAAVWLYTNGKAKAAVIVTFLAAVGVLTAFGLSSHAAIAFVLIGGGLTAIWRRGGSLRQGTPVSIVGVLLVSAGIILLLFRGGPSTFLAPGAIGGALLLIVGPWLWQLVLERDAERTARIRTDERAEMAARIHDSVLQTLALIQRHTDDPKRIASLARSQERELRGWLYGDGAATGGTLMAALADAGAEIEETHGTRVEIASGGDCPLDDDVRAVVLAAREAMQNAAKFSGADEISVYAEADEHQVSVFVRDRGTGFDRTAVPADRRGIAESIEGRLARAGGSATITSSPKAGTEVELRLTRRA